MLAFTVRRFISMIVTLIIISIISFILINLPAGTYLDVYMAELQERGGQTAMRQVELLERRYGLDQPMYVQYYRWIGGFFRGDFGRSFMYNRPVRDVLFHRMGYTLLVAVVVLIFTWIVAIPIGIYSAVNQYSIGDNIFTFFSFIGLSIPNFLIALILMIFANRVFGTSIGGLFSSEYANAPWSFGKFIDLLQHLWVVIIVLGTAGTAELMRIMRGNLLDILNEQYIQSARSKGLTEKVVIIKHAVRNAINPLIMYLGMSFPRTISRLAIVAIVLSLPTGGPLYLRALQTQDMYLAGTFLIFMAITLVVGNFISDLILAKVDPRVKYE